MSSRRPFRSLLAGVVAPSLLLPAVGLGAPARLTADPAAQASQNTGKADPAGALVARRGSFVRAGLQVDAPTTCADPGLILEDLASGAKLRMPILDAASGAALTRLNADALALRAKRHCTNGALAACGWQRDETNPGGSVFQRTLQAGAFGTGVVLDAEGLSLTVTTGGAGKAAGSQSALAQTEAGARYVELVAAAGTPYYAVVMQESLQAGDLRAALAVWLPEDMPIGAYTVGLACGAQAVGEGLPVVVLFNPFDVTTAEVAAPEVAALTLQGRAEQVAGPVRVPFALSPPDAAARDVALEMIADFPLAARRHPALVAQIAAKGRGPIQLTGRANYAKAGGKSDAPFVAGETSAILWKHAAIWNDASGHFDLWDGQLAAVGNGAWPYAGATRVRVRGSHTLGDSFADGHVRSLAFQPPGTVTEGELAEAVLGELLAATGCADCREPWQWTGSQDLYAKLGKVGGLVGKIKGAAKGSLGKEAGLTFPEGDSQAPGGFAVTFGEGKGAYSLGDFLGALLGGDQDTGSTGTYGGVTGSVVRTRQGAVPTGGVWTWSGGSWSGSGSVYHVAGSWSFQASPAGGSIAVSPATKLPSSGHFIDDWQGETAFLSGKASGPRFGDGTASQGQNVFDGIQFLADTPGAIGIDGVTVCAPSEKGDGMTACKTGRLGDTGSVFKAHKGGGSRGTCKYGQCWVFSCVTGEGLLRATGIPTRPVTNFDSAHEKAGFVPPAGIGPYGTALVRVFGKGEEAGLAVWDFAGYLARHVAGGGGKDSVWNFHVWNEKAFAGHGSSVWSFHVWTEAWVSAKPKDPPAWNAYDATPQEESKAPDGHWGTSGPTAEALAAAAKATGIPADVLKDSVEQPQKAPMEWSHGREP